MHIAVWNMRARSFDLPRSPSEVRDSIQTERRLEEVADSLVDAGEDRDEVEEAVASLREGGGGGFRFGGGGGSEGLPIDPDGNFIERPAEGRPIEAGGGGGRFGGGYDSMQNTIRRLVTGDEGGRRRFRGGDRLFPSRSEPAPWAEPDPYTVVVRVDDEEYSQRFTLDRTETAPES